MKPTLIKTVAGPGAGSKLYLDLRLFDAWKK